MKYLIVKTSSLGDILQTFPVATYLREKSPHGILDWIVEESFAPLVEAHPAVDNVLITKRKYKIPYCFELRKKIYDIVFDLQGNCKSGALTACAHSRAKVGYAWRDLPEWPNGFATNVKFPMPKKKNIRDDYLSLVQNYFDDFTPVKEKPFLFPLTLQEEKEIGGISEGTLICAGAAWPNKCLSLKRWHALLSKIEGPIHFVWGSEKERAFVEQLKEYGTILPKLSLAQLQNVMSRSRKVLCMDSLPLHLCATTATPAFAFFGPSSLEKYLPEGFEGIQGKCPFNITFDKRCPRLRTCKSASCMDLEA
ncbi:MAG: hypothetical protein H7A36_05620 [Chlamydiales bacterium]|nr:hypothetical protein [Chlamydiales bacterium]